MLCFFIRVSETQIHIKFRTPITTTLCPEFNLAKTEMALLPQDRQLDLGAIFLPSFIAVITDGNIEYILTFTDFKSLFVEENNINNIPL